MDFCQKWMGKKIYPLTQNGVLDVDYDYEIKIAENWLKNNGFTEDILLINLNNLYRFLKLSEL